MHTSSGSYVMTASGGKQVSQPASAVKTTPAAASQKPTGTAKYPGTTITTMPLQLKAKYPNTTITSMKKSKELTADDAAALNWLGTGLDTLASAVKSALPKAYKNAIKALEAVSKLGTAYSVAGTVMDVSVGVKENIKKGASSTKIGADAYVDASWGLGPIVGGTVVGGPAGGFIASLASDVLGKIPVGNTTVKDAVKDAYSDAANRMPNTRQQNVHGIKNQNDD